MSSWLPARFLRASSGTTAVEFAFVALPLLLLIVGTLEFGRLMWTRLAIQQTAITAARCMGLRTASCAASGTYSAALTTTYIEQTARSWAITLTSSNLTLNTGATCGGQSGFSSVTITYNFQSAAPQLIDALMGGRTLTTTSCFPNQAA